MKTIDDCEPGHLLSGGHWREDKKCKPISIGYEMNSNKTGQVQCSEGTYQDEKGKENCKNMITSCPSGQYITGGSTTEDRICIEVSKGHELNDNKTGQKQCPEGTYQDEEGKENCKDMKTSCPSGQYITGGSRTKDKECIEVSKGHELNDNGTGQIQCPEGTYQDEEGQDKCKPYISCPPGHYIIGGSTTEDKTCREVSKGYQLNANGTGQIQCPYGTYQDEKGKDNCIPHRIICPSGHYLINDGNKIKDNTCKIYKTKESCGYGQILEGGTPTSDKICRYCPYGHYSENRETCTRVEAGYKLSSDRKGQDPCPAGKYSNGGSQYCSHCPNGQYQDQEAQDKCKPYRTSCESGYYLINDGTKIKDKTCKIVDKGHYYSAWSGQRPCPSGKYQDQEGQLNCKNMKSASNCTAGTYLYGGTGTGNTKDRECKKVDKGHRSNYNRTGQEQCPPRQYQDEIGQEYCKTVDPGYEKADDFSQRPCPDGTYRPGNLIANGNFLSCQKSNPGYQPNDERTLQVKCVPGTFSNNYGMKCKNCSTIGNNYYQPNSGGSSCIQNTSNGYEVNSTHTNKIQCSNDKYSNWNSGWKCTNKTTVCPPGQRFIDNGSTHYDNECWRM